MEADLLQEPAERICLYERAKGLALAHELLACRAEIDRDADDWERQEWEELLAQVP